MSHIPLPHTILPTAPHTHTIIFLHGLGSNALEFHAELFESQSSTGLFFTQLLPGLKWVFPHAPFSHTSLGALDTSLDSFSFSDAVEDEDKEEDEDEDENGRRWFTMPFGRDDGKQKSELKASKQTLLDVIEDEAKTVGIDNIVLAGISQGCATAVYTLLTTSPPLKIGGFIGLCGWLPLADDVRRLATTASGGLGLEEGIKRVPVLLQHCIDDGVVPVRSGEALRDMLVGLGMEVRWECFTAGEELAHWVKEPEGVDGIARFVEAVMRRGNSSPR